MTLIFIWFSSFAHGSRRSGLNPKRHIRSRNPLFSFDIWFSNIHIIIYSMCIYIFLFIYGYIFAVAVTSFSIQFLFTFTTDHLVATCPNYPKYGFSHPGLRCDGGDVRVVAIVTSVVLDAFQLVVFCQFHQGLQLAHSIDVYIITYDSS